MTTYTFNPDFFHQYVNWSDPNRWVGGGVPNSPDADVILPYVNYGSQPYKSTITVQQSYTTNTVTVDTNTLELSSGTFTVNGTLSIRSGGTVNSGLSGNNDAILSVGSVDNHGQLSVYGKMTSASPVINWGTMSGVFSFSQFTNNGTLTNALITTPHGGFTNLQNSTLTGGYYTSFYNGGYVQGLSFNVGSTIDTLDATIFVNNPPNYEVKVSSVDSAGTSHSLQDTLRTVGSSGSLRLNNVNYTTGLLDIEGSLILGGRASFKADQLIVGSGGTVSVGVTGEGVSLTGPITNAGTINGSGFLSGPIINNGTIEAISHFTSSVGSTLIVTGPISGTGNLVVGSTPSGVRASTLELGDAASQRVSFEDSLGGLILDQPTKFTGSIAPVAGGNTVTLPVISPDSITSYSYSGDSNSGTLTLQQSNGSSLSLNFIGHYDTNSFKLSAGSGLNITEVAYKQDQSVFDDTAHNFASGGAKVFAFYDGLLSRTPDPSGDHTYTEQLKSGLPLHDLAQTMLTSAEFTSKVGDVTKLSDSDFVKYVYQAVLHRSADSNGLSHYQAALSGGESRADVAVEFVLSSEHLNRLHTTHDAFTPGGEIYSLYDALLGRTPDPLGFELQVKSLETGTSLRDVAAAGLTSDEWTSHYGRSDQMSGADFIQQLYRVALHRDADAGGLQTYENALAKGQSRADVAVSLSLSDEHVGRLDGAFQAGIFVPDKAVADAARLYYGVLGRVPDQGGLQTYGNQLEQGRSLTDLAKDFLGSQEYASKYGSPDDQHFIEALYQGAAGRHSDPGGMQGYLDEIQHGVSRADVAVQIVESPEAQQHHLAQIEAGWLFS